MRSGAARLTWVELKLFLRDPFATVFALVFPFIMLVLLAAVFGNTPDEEEVNGELIFRGVGGADYYTVASIALVIAAIGLLGLPVHLAGYREQGVLRRFRASGVPAWALFVAQLVAGIAVATAGSLLMLATNRAIYGTPFPDAPLGVLVAFLLATLCFTTIGFLLAGLVRTARAAQGMSVILFFCAWMLSGTGPPLAVLPSAARAAGELSPLQHAMLAIQDPWFGFGWNAEELLTLAAITAAAGAIAVWRTNWD
jgi:ABC-2 type transport system permease protein